MLCQDLQGVPWDRGLSDGAFWSPWPVLQHTHWLPSPLACPPHRADAPPHLSAVESSVEVALARAVLAGHTVVQGDSIAPGDIPEAQ